MRSTTQWAWESDDALYVVSSLDDFHAQAGDRVFHLPCIVAAVGPDHLEPWGAASDLVEDQRSPVAVLSAGGMDVGPSRQT